MNELNISNLEMILLAAGLVAAWLLWVLQGKLRPKRFTCYEHHGCQVVVQKKLKGKHRDHCLCHSCASFHPGSKENCPMAKTLYRLCVDQNMVTPVWECPKFQPVEK